MIFTEPLNTIKTGDWSYQQQWNNVFLSEWNDMLHVYKTMIIDI